MFQSVPSCCCYFRRETFITVPSSQMEEEEEEEEEADLGTPARLDTAHGEEEEEDWGQVTDYLVKKGSCSLLLY